VLRKILDGSRKKWQEAGENCIKRSVVVCTVLLAMNYTGDKLKEDEMG